MENVIEKVLPRVNDAIVLNILPNYQIEREKESCGSLWRKTNLQKNEKDAEVAVYSYS